MSKLIDIQNQIERLQRQASEIRAKEMNKTVQEILGKMEAFGISLKDLQAAMSKGKGRARTGSEKVQKRGKSTMAGTKVAPKYRGPNGETWTGRGQQPRWLADLVAQGRAKEEFAIGTSS